MGTASIKELDNISINVKLAITNIFGNITAESLVLGYNKNTELIVVATVPYKENIYSGIEDLEKGVRQQIKYTLIKKATELGLWEKYDIRVFDKINELLEEANKKTIRLIEYILYRHYAQNRPESHRIAF